MDDEIRCTKLLLPNDIPTFDEDVGATCCGCQPLRDAAQVVVHGQDATRSRQPAGVVERGEKMDELNLDKILQPMIVEMAKQQGDPQGLLPLDPAAAKDAE